MDEHGPMQITAHESIREIPEADWDACAVPERADGGRPRNPFVSHAFLEALERSGSVGPGTGWRPAPLSLRRGGEILGVAPLYVKSHSQGEYVFDHAWADAWMRAGGQYYPKLQIAVPFTPVAGPRLLARPGPQAGAVRKALLEGAIELARENRLSSLHVTFCEPDLLPLGEALGLLHRIGHQYHWENRGYADFDAFLATLSSRKRKTIRRERREAQGFGGEIVRLSGDRIRPEHWDAFWEFYQSTGARKWGDPYLTRPFFDLLHERMRRDVLLVLALRGGRPVAGALNLIGREALFGRYWGCTEHHPFLHFELCYYQAIEHAIAHRLKRVEAGAQGEHKIFRGYLPVATHSLHWIADPGFRAAVAKYLDDEREAEADEAAFLARLAPFRKADGA